MTRKRINRSLRFFVAMLVAFAVSCSSDDDSTTAATSSGDFTLKGSGSSSTSLQESSGIDPANLMMKLYGFYVSESANCTDMIEVYSSTAPTATDVLDNPTFGQEVLADGTYNCIAYKISDEISFAPSSSSEDGICVANESQTLEICRGADDLGTAGVHPDGTEFNCTEGVEDVITFYVSTIGINDETRSGDDDCSRQEGGDTATCSAFRKPEAENNKRGLLLSSAMVKSGAITGVIVIDATGKVGVSPTGDEGSDRCELQAPSFSFRTE